MGRTVKIIIWILLSLLVVFLQSLWLVSWPAWLLMVFLAWRGSELGFWLISILGLMTDLFLLEPLGKNVIIGLAIVLIVNLLKRVFGLGPPPVKISNDL